MRKFIRHPSDIPIEYDLRDVIAHRSEYLTNVGHGGLCFRSRCDIELGATINVRIPVCQPIFEARGVVVWCRKTEGYFEVGVSFSDVETEFGVRMVEQVCQIEHYKNEVLAREGRTMSGADAAAEWIEKNAAGFPR